MSHSSIPHYRFNDSFTRAHVERPGCRFHAKRTIHVEGRLFIIEYTRDSGHRLPDSCFVCTGETYVRVGYRRADPLEILAEGEIL